MAKTDELIKNYLNIKKSSLISLMLLYLMKKTNYTRM